MLSVSDFFEDALDLSVPELKTARDLFLAGDEAGAMHTFAEYARSVLDYEKYMSVRFVKEQHKHARDHIIAVADEIVNFKFGACGFTHQYTPGAMDWHLNPTPNHYCEYPWQVNRLHMLEPLGTAYRFTGDEKYAKQFAYLLSTWIEQNPFPIVKIEQYAGSYDHIAWRSIETGERMESAVPYAIHCFIGSPSVSDELLTRFFMSVWEHAFQLEHFYSSHNWLIIELTGLFNLSTVYPFFRLSKKWQKFAAEKMFSELSEQLYPEGFQYELTTGYHIMVANLYAELLDLAKTYEVNVADGILARIHDMYEVILKLLSPDLRVPGLNDGDTYKYCGQMTDALYYFPDDEVFRYIASDRKEGTVPPYNSLCLPTVGFCAMRTGWDEKRDMWALFDGAHFGWGHQHEDKLSFDLYAYGTHLLSDPGNYEYDSSKMRTFVCATRSHNTALVDGFDQNRRATFSGAEEARKVKERTPSDLKVNLGGDTYEVCEASYNKGYGPKDALVMVDHHRKVIFFKKGLGEAKPFFLLLDTFTPADGEEHLYEVLFQLGTEPITAQGHDIRVTHPDGVTMDLISSAYPRVIVGQNEPRYMGWKKDRSAPGTDKEHFPAPAILFTERSTGSEIATVVYPDKDGTCPIGKVSVDREAGTFTIEVNGKPYSFREDDAAFAAFAPAPYSAKD